MMDLTAFQKISYGVYVISSLKEGKLNGQIANTAFQISSEPPTIAISINKNNLTHQFIEESKVFSVSVLAKSVPLNLIGHFGFKSGRDLDKFANLTYKTGTTGAPVLLENTVGYLEAEVINSIDVITHTVFIGKVVNAEVLNSDEPMTYAYYHEVKRGTTPPAAPTYFKNEEKPEAKEEEGKMKTYKCSVCGYIYDPAKGDPESGVKPGTAFEDLPDDWSCPVCGVAKDSFEEVKS